MGCLFWFACCFAVGFGLNLDYFVVILWLSIWLIELCFVVGWWRVFRVGIRRKLWGFWVLVICFVVFLFVRYCVFSIWILRFVFWRSWLCFVVWLISCLFALFGVILLCFASSRLFWCVLDVLIVVLCLIWFYCIVFVCFYCVWYVCVVLWVLCTLAVLVYFITFVGYLSILMCLSILWF